VVFTFVKNYSENVSKDYFDCKIARLNWRVTMKQFISLLLIISITIISWSSFAQSKVIKVNSLYIQPSTSVKSMVIKPFLSNQLINDNFALTSSKISNNHNDFFAATMVFNEKLQQFIAFFDDSHNEIEEVANNHLSSSKNSEPNIQKCKASS